MPKRLTITVPHKLGAAEVRRRIDLHMDWALRRLEKEKIQVEAEDWFGNRRAFSGSGYGQKASVAIQVTDDALQIEALVPWMASLFAPVIEAVGRHYAGRLLSDEGAS
jgi:predicted metal-dependent hydrolase